MRTSLIALAATFGIAGLAAASLAVAGVPSVNGGSSLSVGSVSAGGGGTHGGGGGGGGGGAHGGGGYAGGHFPGGGHLSGGYAGHFGGGYGGGAYGGHAGFAAHPSLMAHGGYVAHGTSGYRVVGYESAAPARVGAAPHFAHGGRMSLALGPRMGSAATAARLDHMGHADRIHPRPGHPGRPGYPKRPHHVRLVQHVGTPYEIQPAPPMFCSNFAFQPRGKHQYADCLTPIKAKMLRAR